MKTKEQIHIGIYRLGDTNVDLYGRNGFGGDFYFVPDKKSLPRIKVGFGYDHWWEVVTVLLHESFEFLASGKMARYVPCGSTSLQTSDVYLFKFEHNVFTKICDDQAYFLTKALPDLASAWKRWKRKKP